MGVILTQYSGRRVGSSLPNFAQIDSHIIHWGDPRQQALGALASYPDRNGSAIAFTGTGTDRPTVVAGGINGLRCISWNGVNNRLQNAAVGALLSGTAVPHTFAVVATCADAVPLLVHRCFYILCNSGAIDPTTPTMDFYLRSESFGIHCDRRDDAAVEVSYTGNQKPDTAPHVWILDFDGGTINIYCDRILVGSQNVGGGALTANNFVYGSHYRATVDEAPYNGLWGESCLWSVSLGATKCGQVFDYLSAPWNILPGAAKSWSPFVLGGIQSWRDSYSTNGTFGGSSVPTWFGRVFDGAESYDATGSGTGFGSVINGNNGILFDGIADQYASDQYAVDFLSGIDQVFTQAGVFHANTNVGINTLFGCGSSGDIRPLHKLKLNALGGSPYEVFRRDDLGVLVASNGGSVDTTAHSFVYKFLGTVDTLIVDGANVWTNQPLNVGTMSVDLFTIGADRRMGITIDRFSGYMIEQIGCNIDVVGADLTSLVAYLRGRSGV